MSETARLAAEGGGPLEVGIISARAPRWRQPPAWLWGASVLVQVVCAAALTGYTFFFVDDFLFLEQARTQSFDLSYLREPLFEHFSPVSRLLDRLLVDVAPGSFVLAHGVELALYAGALGAFALVVRTIVGNGWSAFALTLVFGQSIFLIRLLNWWTATANILPATIFTLLALWCYLRWREVGSRSLLAGCFAAFALSLFDYETAILLPAYLAIISLLVLERRPGPRAWLATLYRERWAWAGFALLDAAALVNFEVFYYTPAVRPPFPAVVHYLEIALFQTFVPALVGIKYPEAPLSAHPAVIVAAGIVVGAAVAVTLYLRPRAWRCLVAFILIFLVTMLPVALSRITQFGVTVAHVIYYQQSLQFMFLVLAAFAISPRWSGRRASPALGSPASSAAGRGRLTIRAPSPGVLAVGGAAAVALYVVLYLTSLQALVNVSWQPRRDSAYVREYLTSNAQVRAKSGREPVLIDLKVPHNVLPIKLWPYTTYNEFFALFNPRLRVDEIVNPAYVVNPHGRLLAVSFAAATSGLTGQARASALDGSADAAAPFRASSMACVPARRAASWLGVPLALEQQMSVQTDGRAYALRVHFAMPVGAPVVIRLLAIRGGLAFATVTHVWSQGSGGQLIPLPFTGQLRELDFRLPARACVTRAEFGQLRFTHVR